MDNVNVELIEFIQNNAKPSFVEINGVTYNQKLNNSLEPIEKIFEESRLVKNPVNLNFLTGLTDFIEKNPDGFKFEYVIAHIEDYKKVSIKSILQPFGSRQEYARATFDEPDKKLNNFWDVESFLIRLNSTFEDTAELREFIQIVSSVRDINESKLADDGITQIASTKAGIDLVSEKKLPKFVRLKPVTTFFEVEQPVRPFLFRIKKESEEIKFALFECDGGAYKNECVKRIRDYLSSNLPKEVTIIA